MSNNRAEQLQFLRFFAFLLVCAHHLRPYNVAWFPGEPGACTGVVFFFVLGGFVSGLSSYDREIHFSLRSEKEYLVKKLRRFYPLYFVTIMFAVIYSEIPPAIVQHEYRRIIPELIQLAKCLLLLQSWFPADFFSFNAVGWFLSTIFFLYAVNLPLRSLFSKIKKLEHSALLFGITAAAAFAGTCLYCYAARDTDILYTEYVLPISRLGEYVCGMALGYLVCPLVRRVQSEDRKMFWIFTAIEAATLFFWLYNMYTPFQRWEQKIVHWLLPNCMLIVTFAFGKGLLSKLFRNKWLVYLGDICFECFMIHVVLIRMVIYTQVFTAGVDLDPVGKAFYISFIVIMSTLIAAVISKTKAPAFKKIKYS